MRRTAGLALLTVAVLASAACGGGSPSEATQARAVVERFYSDIEGGRGTAACALLTPAARKEAVRPLQLFSPRKQFTCGQLLQSYSDATKRDPASVKGLRAAKFGSVSVVGNRALVAVEVPRVGLRAAPLLKTPAGWRITQVGTSFRKPISG